MLRKIIIGLLGVAIIVAAVLVARKLSSSRDAVRPVQRTERAKVVTREVINGTSTIKIVTSGQLVAKHRVDLFAEARGVLQPSSKNFKPGVYYKKGEVIFDIENAQEVASLRAQKSSLFNQIVALMPDLRLDYPESFEHWEAYIDNFDIEGPLVPLPEPVSAREKLFIAGRNIYTTYYNTVTLETSLRDFRIVAPFNGVVTEALVQSGTMVSPGQQIGTILDPSVYELEAPVNVEYLDLLRIGKPVELSNIAHSARYSGKVVRVDGNVDRASQTITAFVEVSGEGLKEGMYLEASIDGREEPGTYELPRNLLINQSQVFAVEDSTLYLKTVEPVFFRENEVVVKGLDNGTRILAQPVPGAYAGMPVEVVSTNPNVSTAE